MKLVIAVGLPGSGKSTFLAGPGTLSSDAVRLLLIDDETDQTINAAVFRVLRSLASERLNLDRPVTRIDATNLTERDRAPWIELANQHGCEIEALYFDVPLEICKARNKARRRVVPEEAMDLLAAKLTPPSLAEGFSRIEVVSTLPQIPPQASAG